MDAAASAGSSCDCRGPPSPPSPAPLTNPCPHPPTHTRTHLHVGGVDVAAQQLVEGREAGEDDGLVLALHTPAGEQRKEKKGRKARKATGYQGWGRQPVPCQVLRCAGGFSWGEAERTGGRQAGSPDTPAPGTTWQKPGRGKQGCPATAPAAQACQVSSDAHGAARHQGEGEALAEGAAVGRGDGAAAAEALHAQPVLQAHNVCRGRGCSRPKGQAGGVRAHRGGGGCQPTHCHANRPPPCAHLPTSTPLHIQRRHPPAHL